MHYFGKADEVFYNTYASGNPVINKAFFKF